MIEEIITMLGTNVTQHFLPSSYFYVVFHLTINLFSVALKKQTAFSNQQILLWF